VLFPLSSAHLPSEEGYAASLSRNQKVVRRLTLGRYRPFLTAVGL
jgi:hypothetical protein